MRRSDTIAMLRSPFAAAGAALTIHLPSPRVTSTRACLDEAPEPALGAESGLAMLTRNRAAAICVVCLDDRLHELVANHVALVEVDERDALDLADDFHRLHQA